MTRRAGLAAIAVVAAIAVAAPSVGVVGAAGRPTLPARTAVAGGWTAQERPGARLPDPQPQPAEARQRAEEIVSRPEYQPPEPNPLEKLLDWLLERLGELLRPVGTLAGGGASPVLVWIVVALLAGAAVFFLTRIVGARRRRVSDDSDDALDLRFDEERPVSAWQRDADSHEAAGRWKEGLLCRYRALIGTLVARGVVRDIPGRTTGEYRVEIAQRVPAVSAAFAGATELFDRAWYGNRETGPAEAERFRELAAEVLLGTDSAELVDGVRS